jgi:hypothetical protein
VPRSESRESGLLWQDVVRVFRIRTAGGYGGYRVGSLLLRLGGASGPSWTGPVSAIVARRGEARRLWQQELGVGPSWRLSSVLAPFGWREGEDPGALTFSGSSAGPAILGDRVCFPGPGLSRLAQRG